MEENVIIVLVSLHGEVGDQDWAHSVDVHLLETLIQ